MVNRVLYNLHADPNWPNFDVRKFSQDVSTRSSIPDNQGRCFAIRVGWPNLGPKLGLLTVQMNRHWKEIESWNKILGWRFEIGNFNLT